LLFIVILSCEIKNPAENLKLIVAFSPISTVVAVDVINPESQGYVTQSVTIRIEGEDKGSVVDVTGKSIVSPLSTTTGIASFAITEDIVPTLANPVKLLLVVEADGFITTSKPVTIQNTQRQSVTVNLVEIDNLPEGVSGTTDDSGTANPITGTAASIVVETLPETPTDPTVQVEIDQNTVILDAGGEPLSGQLTTSVVYFDGESTESLESFPGGFTVNVQDNPEGEDEGSFVTAGFVAVDIQDENGNEAESFTQPVTIVMELADGQTDPDGNLVEVGDIIPIWSYDEETGEWTYEADGVVAGPNANGKLYVEYQVTHLSYWNLDWFWNSCFQSRKIIFDGWLAEYGGLYLVLSGNGFWHDAYVWGDNWIIFYLAPDFPLDIKAYAGGPGGIPVDEWTGQLLCADGDLVLDVDVPEEISDNMGSRTFHITGACENQGDLEVRPTTPVWFRKTTETSWTYAGMLEDGVLTINGLVLGQAYVFATSYEGEWYEAGFTIGTDYTVLIPEYADQIHLEKIEGDDIYYTVDLPQSVCDELNE
jgi:hypothetical protein